VAAIAEEVEQVVESVALEQRALRSTAWLPPARIVLVPFSLVEVELLPEDE
jgi:hypothetical protein